MIQFNNVSKLYPNRYEALSSVSFSLKKGEMAFLTGHSGAGKTTLLKLIALLERPSRGQIIVNQQNLNRLKPSAIPYMRRNCGLIFQTPSLLVDRTLFENISLPLIIAGYRFQEISRRVRAALDKVGLLNKEKLFPGMLSCGEQQRAGIARAIVSKPSIILADEPTGNLDPSLSAEIMHLFEQFKQVGVTILIASHDLALIKQMHHRIITLSHGRLTNDVSGEL
jgi:cell division transport system ATP-binding protein